MFHLGKARYWVYCCWVIATKAVNSEESGTSVRNRLAPNHRSTRALQGGCPPCVLQVLLVILYGIQSTVLYCFNDVAAAIIAFLGLA